jgi:hypothetical protein
MYKEHTLPSGEIMLLIVTGDCFEVECIDADGETVRWHKNFATLAKAEAEYIRFDK